MSTPSSPLGLDAKTKFQQLWAQFGTAFMEEPMLRDHSKRVEDLVRENERLRLEISSAKAEQSKQSSEHKLTAEELENLREEVNHEVKSGMERVQERNVALARKEKEVAGLRREIKGREAIWAQERLKYKQTIRLLRDELQSAVVAHERLRKNVGVLTGEYEEGSGDEYDEEEEEELANQAELQLQAERSLQAGASYRRASRRLQVEETPGVEEADENAEPEEEQEEYEYYEVDNGDVYEEQEAEEDDEDDEAEHQVEEEEEEEETSQHGEEEEAEEAEEEAPADAEDEEAAEPEQPLRRSTRIRHSEVSAVSELVNGNQTVELIGTKRGRDQSSDRATVDGAAQIPDRQTEYNGVPPTQPESTEASDVVERPAKRTRRQTERYSNALESNKNFAKIMTPPATSPPFLPSVLPRRRSPARKPTALSQTSTPVNRRGPKRGAAAVQPSPANAPPKAKATQTAKSPEKTPAKTPAKAPKSPAKSLKSPRVIKKSQPKSPWSAYPKTKFDFTLVSGFKHGRNCIVDDTEIRDQMMELLPRTTDRIRQVAVTPGFWRSYAHKRNIQRKEQGLSEHCAFTSQYPLDSKEVETENQWVDGVDFACSNCIREGIVCFTVGERLDTEKYGAVYRPPKRS